MEQPRHPAIVPSALEMFPLDSVRHGRRENYATVFHPETAWPFRKDKYWLYSYIFANTFAARSGDG